MAERRRARKAGAPLALLCALGLATAAPAHAEFPVALRADGGIGLGSGQSQGRTTGRRAALGGGDLLWRRVPGRPLVLSARFGVEGVPSASKDLYGVLYDGSGPLVPRSLTVLRRRC